MHYDFTRLHYLIEDIVAHYEAYVLGLVTMLFGIGGAQWFWNLMSEHVFMGIMITMFGGIVLILDRMISKLRQAARVIAYADSDEREELLKREEDYD